MIRYRPFQNSDPPRLVDIWRTQPPERGLMQPMSIDWFDQLVFAKPYFDRQGLIVACDGDEPVGFVHAAFGPRDDYREISHQLGVTCLVMVRANYQRQGIGAELLTRSEAYLREHGAQVLYAGGIRPLDGFYLGLYGGSELPGVLDSTPKAQRLFLMQGYREIDRTWVYQRTLAGFRPPVDRHQQQLRRRCQVQSVADPAPANWWEACTRGVTDRVQFEVVSRQGYERLGQVTFWTLQPLSLGWGVHAVGLVDLEVGSEHRRQGVATFLLSEAFRQLHAQGFSLVEAQTMQANTAARQLYDKLGFHSVDQGAVYRKE